MVDSLQAPATKLDIKLLMEQIGAYYERTEKQIAHMKENMEEWQTELEEHMKEWKEETMSHFDDVAKHYLGFRRLERHTGSRAR
jgi:uncharacterized protein YhaN